MTHWTPYIFVRLVFFVILGILLYHYFPILTFEKGFIIFSSLSILYLTIYFFFSRKFNPRINSSKAVLIFLILITFGYLRSYQYQATNDKLHIVHFSDTTKAYVAVIDAQVLEKNKYQRTELMIEKVKIGKKWIKRNGRVLAYFRTNISQKNKLKYGQKLLIYGSPYMTKSTGNPKAFDYAKYLAIEKNIYHQHFIKPKSWIKIGYQPQNNILLWAYQIREGCNKTLKKYIKSEQEYSIATALILGIKDGLDNSIKDAYSSAGLMHILAVSGLHVGIITYILVLFLGNVRKLPYGKTMYLILIGLSLGFYTLLTGFSPSVVRASLMFFLLVLGENLQRSRSPYNTLAFVAFCLLIYKPTWLFSVGFQLSFLAVISIFYVQPKIYQWFTFKYLFFDKAWQIISVSIAAQLATAPLAIYYFHQFPNYFLLSNLLILPIIAGIIYTCLAVIIFSWIPILNIFIGFIAKWSIFIMNQVIFTLEKLPFALSEALYLDIWQVYATYILIYLVLMFFALKKFEYLLYVTFVLAIISISRIVTSYQQNFQEKLVIYDLPQQANLSFVQGKNNILLSQNRIGENTFEFNVQNHLYNLGIKKSHLIKFADFKNNPRNNFTYQDFEKYALLFWQHQSFLVIKSYLNYYELQTLKKLKTNYTIIQNNAVWDLEKFVETIPSQFLILDSSNSFYRSQKLLKQAKQLKIPCHAVSNDGAFILEKN